MSRGLSNFVSENRKYEVLAQNINAARGDRREVGYFGLCVTIMEFAPHYN